MFSEACEKNFVQGGQGVYSSIPLGRYPPSPHLGQTPQADTPQEDTPRVDTPWGDTP